MIGNIKDSGKEPEFELERTLANYPKYHSSLTKEDILISINNLYKSSKFDNQTYFKF